MSLGVNIAIGLGTALFTRAISNAAYQATMPQVDPSMPTAGPVLAAAALPTAGGALLYRKYPKISSALFGLAAGGAISTAEYMAYAKGAGGGQLPATAAGKDRYYWVLVHKDASLELTGDGMYSGPELPAKDKQIVDKYGADPDIIQITRKNPDGTADTLFTKGSQSSGAVRLLRGQSGGIGVPQIGVRGMYQ